MERDSQTAVINNSCKRIGTPGRGRGRGRFKRCPETENTPKAALANDISAISGKTLPSSTLHSQQTEIGHGQFEDPEPSRSLSDNKHKDSLPASAVSEEKSAASDKENSSSPRPQRSRRSVFDSRLMSQINSHLQQGIKEQSDLNMTRSLDRINKEMSHSPSPRNVCVSHLGSPNLRIEIPPDNPASHTQYRATLPKKLLSEGRPRSLTDPAPSPAGEDFKGRRVHETETKSSGMFNQIRAVHPLSSVSSPLSATKPRGRGRGRGRARSKQSVMEATPQPGPVSDSEGSSSRDLSKPQSQNTAADNEQFTDATGGRAKSNGHVYQGVPSNSSPVSKAASDNENGLDSGCRSFSPDQSSTVPASQDESFSRPASADESGSQAEGAAVNRPSKGLTLKIAPNDHSPVTGPSVSSPEDIVFLLSPDHEFTLDWAAAMATPTPDTSSDSAPDWNVSNFSY